MLLKARPDELIYELITLHNQDLILRYTAIMRSQLINEGGKNVSLLKFEPWSPGTKSQWSTNDLC